MSSYSASIWRRSSNKLRQSEIWLEYFYLAVLFLAALVLVSKYSLIHANMIKIMISFAILFPALLIYIYNNQVDWEPAIALALGQGLGAWIATKFALENKNASIWVRRILIVMILLAIIKLFNLYTYFI